MAQNILQNFRSLTTQAPYGVAHVTAVWGVARSSFYAARQRE